MGSFRERGTAQGVPAGPFRLGTWRIDPDARELTDGARTRRLTPKAMQVLLELAAAGGRVVSRDDLLDRAWPGVIVGEESLTHAIAELRGALDDPARAPRLIETVRKSGYRLLAVPETAPPRAPDETAVFDPQTHLLCGAAAVPRDRAGPPTTATKNPSVSSRWGSRWTYGPVSANGTPACRSISAPSTTFQFGRSVRKASTTASFSSASRLHVA